MILLDRMDGLSEWERLMAAKEVFDRFRRSGGTLCWDEWVGREMKRAEPVRRNCDVYCEAEAAEAFRRYCDVHECGAEACGCDEHEPGVGCMSHWLYMPYEPPENGENRDFDTKAENSPSGAFDASDDKGQGSTPETPSDAENSATTATTGGKAPLESPKRRLVEMTAGMDGPAVRGRDGSPLLGIFGSAGDAEAFLLKCCSAYGWRLTTYRRKIFLRPGVTVVDFGDYRTFARVTELP